MAGQRPGSEHARYVPAPALIVTLEDGDIQVNSCDMWVFCVSNGEQHGYALNELGLPDLHVPSAAAQQFVRELPVSV